MSVEKVKEYFKEYGIEDRIQEFEVSSATVDLAAKALNTEPQRIGKSLAFKVDDKPILIIAAGGTRIDNPSYKKKFSTKPKMLSPDECQDMIGHAVGGICPFALMKEWKFIWMNL